MNRSWILLVLIFCGLSVRNVAADQVELKRVTWTVGGVEREALVSVPTGRNKPVIFTWHGHGGTSNYAARKFSFHTQWPEAIVIYPQGLPTPTPLIDPVAGGGGFVPVPEPVYVHVALSVNVVPLPAAVTTTVFAPLDSR